MEVAVRQEAEGVYLPAKVKAVFFVPILGHIHLTAARGNGGVQNDVQRFLREGGVVNGDAKGIRRTDGLGKDDRGGRLLRHGFDFFRKRSDGGHRLRRLFLRSRAGKRIGHKAAEYDHQNQTALPDAFPGFRGFLHGGILCDDNPLRLFGIVPDGQLRSRRCIADQVLLRTLLRYPDLIVFSIAAVRNLKVLRSVPMIAL